jgi:hypothetical protein
MELYLEGSEHVHFSERFEDAQDFAALAEVLWRGVYDYLYGPTGQGHGNREGWLHCEESKVLFRMHCYRRIIIKAHIE